VASTIATVRALQNKPGFDASNLLVVCVAFGFMNEGQAAAIAPNVDGRKARANCAISEAGSD
jgi:hypothetical protein